MATPPARRSGRSVAANPSPLRQAVARFSPPSRKRQLSNDKAAEPRPSKIARKGKAKQSDEVEVDVGHKEEVAVEDMVPGIESEEMTPVPDDGEEVVLEEVEEDSEDVEEEGGGAGSAEDAEAEEGAEAEGDEDDQYAPGTLGKPGHPRSSMRSPADDQYGPNVRNTPFKDHLRLR